MFCVEIQEGCALAWKSLSPENSNNPALVILKTRDCSKVSSPCDATHVHSDSACARHGTLMRFETAKTRTPGNENKRTSDITFIMMIKNISCY